MLKNGSVDLLLTRQSITMQEDVYEQDAEEGISYSMPYLFGGLGFTGDPSYVNCADDNIKTFGNCSFTAVHKSSGKNVEMIFTVYVIWKNQQAVEVRNVVDFTTMLTQLELLDPTQMEKALEV